jgi:hypothetical protein
MATTKININGISELDFTNGIASVSNTNDVTTITLAALGVTSVAFTAPTEFNVSGSPITSAGTIALTWKTETANFVFAGPTSGGAATPGFRALVAADIPALPYVTSTSLTAGGLIIGAGGSAIAVGNLTGDVTTSGSTASSVIKLRGAALDATIGTAGAGQDGYVIYWDNASSSYKLKVLTPGTGTVTSVALTAPTEITVGGSPITTSGTIALSWANESANFVFAGPTSGGAATPAFRALVAADIPSLSATYQLLSQKDTASGYAGLDSNTMLKLAEMKLGRNAQTGTSYPVQDSDRATTVTFSNAAAIAVTLPQAGASSTFIDGWWCWLKNIGTGVITVTPTTSTIDSATIMVMPPGSSALLFSNGTNYQLLNSGSLTTNNYFISPGSQQWSGSGAGTANVTAGGDVDGVLFNLWQAQIVKHISARCSVGAAGVTGAFGLSDSLGNKIFSSNSQSLATSNTSYAITLTATYLLLPGAYRFVWTVSNTTANFYPFSPWNIGSSLMATLNANTTKFFKASNGASSGDIPASLGTFSASAVAMGTGIPFVMFES